MNNNMKQIMKDLILGMSVFISILFLPLLIFINSILYVEYLDYMDSVVINYSNCNYWKINKIPEQLTDSQKWKLVTTIGECQIKDKKYFLEENINEKGHYKIKELLPSFVLKYNSRIIGEQAKNYLKEFNKK